MKLVLDTDVVRSGLQSASGASRLVLCGIAEGIIQPLVTVSTLLEYEDVLKRPECLAATGLTAAGVDGFLDGFLERSQRVVVRERLRPSIQDPNDEIFVEALLLGGGEAIVTFNTRDYRAADVRLASLRHTNIPTLSPGEVLRRLTWRPTATTPFVFPPH